MKKLNFGCGNDIQEGWDNADIQKGEGIITFDFDKIPYPLKSNTYDYIESRSVLQMLDRPDNVLHELRRVAKNVATIHFEVPYWHNKGAYNDIQTKHLFNENSFIYFAEEKPCRVDTVKRFAIVKLIKQPTIVGAMMPEFLRNKIDLFLSGIYANLIVEFKVIK